MAILKPFKAYRPTPQLASKVAALPYDVLSSNEARNMVENNPYSFLHVDKAEIDLDPEVDIHDALVYEKARDNLKDMINKGIFVKDAEDRYYIYRQTMDSRSQTGLVGCTSIDDYMNNIILKHEKTRADKEMDRINHVDYTNANTGPIFITYRNKAEIDDLIQSWIDNHEPVYDFISNDHIGHTVWVIDDWSTINKITELFKGVESLYIADGHHRSASAVKVGLKRRAEYPDYDGTEEFNYFLSVLFPDKDLYIMDYNRVIQDLNEFSETEFLELIKEKFIVTPLDTTNQYRPEKAHTFGMYLDKTWYRLEAKEGIFNPDNIVESLDVSILQNNILNPILGIVDPRVDSRIDFVGGIRGLTELEIRVDDGMRVAFSLYPVTIDQLMKIADEGEIMPPKSTWFEPKLRSGLFIHEL
ncbi:DUF1015 domain-containing protein [Tissierella creatinini]|nr:DUF1015 domain-containing protein [Tissierella creatinini]TJX65593.1 DUF1015 domain-containing protein [Soehngenia saccharolytica]